MSKFLKFTLIGIASVVLLVVVVIGGILLFVDPNEYKGEITTAVQDATGRQLTITGDIKLSIYPWLGLSLGATQLSNAKGFGDTPFASVEAVDVKVKLLPLLQQRIEMQKIRLNGLRANLAKNKAGISNWADLSGPPTEPASQLAPKGLEPKGVTPDIPATPAGATTSEPIQATGILGALAIGGLELVNAHLEWDDQQAGQHVIVDKLTLKTGALALSAPTDLSLSLDVQMHHPEIKGHVEFSGLVSFNLETQQYRADQLDLTVKAKGSGLPVSPVDARLLGNIKADLGNQQVDISDLLLTALGSTINGKIHITDLDKAPNASGDIHVTVTDPEKLLIAAALQVPGDFRIEGLTNAELETTFAVSLKTQTASLNKLKIKIAGLDVRGDIAVKQLLDTPTASVTLSIANFSPRAVTKTLGIPVPNTSDVSVLNKAQLDLDFTGNLHEANVKQLSVVLDDTTLTGKGSVKNFSEPMVRFDLEADGIDVDRYLPPATETPASPPPSPGAVATAAATQLPLELLRTLIVDGNIRLGKLKIAGARLSDIKLGMKANGGQLHLQPFRAKLYNGNYSGNIGLDVRSNTPKLSLDEALTDVNVGPLLKDVMGEELVSGTAMVKAQLAATGTDIDAIRKTLNGKANFSFRDGAVKGVSIGQIIREAYARFNNKPAPPKTENETDFAEMTGSLTITNGAVDNRDLKAKSPLLRISGEGNVNLSTERINYLVNASVVESNEGQAGKELEDLKALTIPIKVTGTFSKPNYSLDLGPVLQARVKREIENEKKKLKKDVDKKIEDEKNKLRKQFEKDLKKKLGIKF